METYISATHVIKMSYFEVTKQESNINSPNIMQYCFEKDGLLYRRGCLNIHLQDNFIEQVYFEDDAEAVKFIALINNQKSNDGFVKLPTEV